MSSGGGKERARKTVVRSSGGGWRTFLGEVVEAERPEKQKGGEMKGLVQDQESWYRSGREKVTKEGTGSARLHENVNACTARLPAGCVSTVVNFGEVVEDVLDEEEEGEEEDEDEEDNEGKVEEEKEKEGEEEDG